MNDMAEALEELSQHLIADGNTKEAKAYHHASMVVNNADHIPADPSSLDGIGDSMRDVVSEYMHSGEIERLNQLRSKHPYLNNLMQVDGIGPKTARRINDELGIETVDELIERADELSQVHLIGEKTARKLKRAAKKIN